MDFAIRGLAMGAAACVLVATSGCATIVAGTTHTLNISSTPPGAACQLSRNGESLGNIDSTPGALKFNKSKETLNLVCRKHGYLDAQANLPANFESWTMGNVIFGGIIGVFVDAHSGALHSYQNSINVSLSPEKFRTAEQRDAFFDAWRKDVMRETANTKETLSRDCKDEQCRDLLRRADAQTEIALAEIEVSRAKSRLEQASEQAAAASKANTAGPVSTSTFLRSGDQWKYRVSHRGRDLGTLVVEVQFADGKSVRERVLMDGVNSYNADRTVSEQFAPRRFESALTLPGGYQLLEIGPYLEGAGQLQAGKRWEDIAGEVSILGVGRKTFVAQAVVVGQETVRVPAGEFLAWKVEVISNKINLAGNGNTTEVKCTYWYAPNARRSIKMRMQVDTPIIAAQAQEEYELVAMGAVP